MSDIAVNENLSSNEGIRGEEQQLQIGVQGAESVDIETVEEIRFC